MADAAPVDRFKNGDPFDYSLVTPQSQMVATMLEGWGYAASTAPKAVAIDSRGLGFVSIKPNAGEGDAARTALEACFVIGGGLPCTLLANGDTFAIDDHALASSYNFTLATPTTLDALPFVDASVRTTDVATYTNLAGFKSIAVSLDGFTSMLRSSDDVFANQAEANRIMLERCEMQAALTPCLLFAQANTIGLDVVHPAFVAQIDFSRTVVQINLPGTTGQHYSQFVPSYLNGVAQGLVGSIFLGPQGQGGTQTGSNAATVRAQAQASCTSHVLAGEPPCFPYATGRAVTFKPMQMAAFQISAEVHCLSMPRPDCAAHKAIGCSAGMYYTTHTGSVELEACN